MSFNDFDACLAQSHAASDLPFWEECYRKVWPDLVALCDHRENGEHQLAGIDRSIVLPNSKQILVDEKVRGRNRITGVVYEDIALEEWSKENVAPGWVVKPLRADFIAYAIAPLGKCYLLPVPALQAAWRQFGEEWKRTMRRIVARNPGYNTICWAVGPKLLFGAMARMSIVEFEPFELSEG